METYHLKRLHCRSLTQLLDMRDSLQTTLTNVLAGNIPRRCDGVCQNWYTTSRDMGHPTLHVEIIDTTSAIAARWEYSKDPGVERLCPVPDVEGIDLWEGPNLVLRLHLMRYLNKRLRDLIRRHQQKAGPFASMDRAVRETSAALRGR